MTAEDAILNNENEVVASERVDEYAPTQAQSKLLLAYGRGEFAGTVEEFCEKADVCKQSYYDMINNPRAYKWWERETTAATERRKYGVYDAIAREAERGNPQAMKLWLERFDSAYIPRSRQDQTIRAEVEALPTYRQAQIEGEGGGDVALPGAEVLKALPEPEGVGEVVDSDSP